METIEDYLGEDPLNLDRLHPSLQGYVRPNRMGGYGIFHPLVHEPFSPLWKPSNRMYDYKRRALAEAKRARDWAQVIWLFERPWRLRKLENLWEHGKLDEAELRSLLASFWVDTESPIENNADPLALFRIAGFTTDDPEAWAALPDRFPVYRGVRHEWAVTGPSWTASEERAEWFARRYAAAGFPQIVATYEVEKGEALAYFSGRGESEVILDFEWASDPDLITERRLDDALREGGSR